MHIIKSSRRPANPSQNLILVRASSATLEVMDTPFIVALLLLAYPRSSLIFLPEEIDPCSVSTKWRGQDPVAYIGASCPEGKEDNFPWLIDPTGQEHTLLDLYLELHEEVLLLCSGSLFFFIAKVLDEQLRAKLTAYQDCMSEFRGPTATQLRALDNQVQRKPPELSPPIERAVNLADMREVCINLRGLPSEKLGYLFALDLCISVLSLWIRESFYFALMSGDDAISDAQLLPHCSGLHLMSIEQSLRIRLLSAF